MKYLLFFIGFVLSQPFNYLDGSKDNSEFLNTQNTWFFLERTFEQVIEAQQNNDTVGKAQALSLLASLLDPTLQLRLPPEQTTQVLNKTQAVNVINNLLSVSYTNSSRLSGACIPLGDFDIKDHNQKIGMECQEIFLAVRADLFGRKSPVPTIRQETFGILFIRENKNDLWRIAQLNVTERSGPWELGPYVPAINTVIPIEKFAREEASETDQLYYRFSNCLDTCVNNVTGSSCSACIDFINSTTTEDLVFIRGGISGNKSSIFTAIQVGFVSQYSNASRIIGTPVTLDKNLGTFPRKIKTQYTDLLTAFCKIPAIGQCQRNEIITLEYSQFVRGGAWKISFIQIVRIIEPFAL